MCSTGVEYSATVLLVSSRAKEENRLCAGLFAAQAPRGSPTREAYILSGQAPPQIFWEMKGQSVGVASLSFIRQPGTSALCSVQSAPVDRGRWNIQCQRCPVVPPFCCGGLSVGNV